MANTETYKGIYAMHKYWGKKPFNEISRFIGQYTNVGDTVLDSFCGSGVTLIEALKMNRKCIGIDINPIAIKLSKVSMTHVDITKLNDVFTSIKNKLKPQINSLYEVNWDGEKTLVTHTIWKKNKPIEVWYTTEKSRKMIRKGTENDVKMSTTPLIEPKWYPTTTMHENSRLNVTHGQSVADLFTPRALVGLSLIREEIKKISDDKIRDVLELTLTGTLSQASNLVFVIRRRKKNDERKPSKAEVGSWVIGYWVPEEHFEINVWNCFENRYKRILKGEREIASMFAQKPVDYFEDNVSLYNTSATSIPVADNSIDYVFIDPPHANRVLYVEQSLMWNSWLNLDGEIQWNKEIIVTEAKKRKDKNIDDYNYLLDLSFAELRRVLKHGKHLSMAFNCLDDGTWIKILNLFTKHGFTITDITPLEYSATSVVQDNRKNALKTDFVLTFQNTELTNIAEITFKDSFTELINIISDLLSRHPRYELYNVMNEIIGEALRDGYIYKVSDIIKVYNEITKQRRSVD